MKKRNRIVINLDQAQAPRSKGRRGGLARALMIIAVVLLLLAGGVAGGGYLWWRHYQNSPVYTLAVLADASQRDDIAAIDGIIDNDKVCDDFVAQVRDHAAGSVAAAIGSVWPTQANAAMQTLSPKLKQTVHDEMVKELKRLTEPAKGKPFILVALAINRYANIKEENNTARLKVDLKDEHLELTMLPATQTDGPRWRITAVQDDKLAKQIADGMTQNLPSSAGAQVQDEVRKQLDKLKKPAK
jgi:hypothetical protein